MNNLKKQVLALGKLSTGLNSSEGQRNELLNEVTEFSKRFLNSLDTTKTFSPEKAKKNAFSIGAEKKSLQEILKFMVKKRL